jgi:predicted RNA polymerase sigma factor
MEPAGPEDTGGIADDRLRLIFVSCHPTLSTEAQVALTLRLVGGLSTAQIARAFLAPEATVAQRIVRAKRSLADAGVRFEVPREGEWASRLPAVLGVVYLIFNEGYAATDGESLTRDGLCTEALRLGHLLARLLPQESEVHGLLALMEFHASRLRTRTDDAGDVVLLADQDRSQWDGGRIAAGVAALATAREGAAAAGPLTLQAELAACHATAPSWERTDWHRIVGLYDQLLALAPSAVITLNRIVALSMRDGPEPALAELSAVLNEPGAGEELSDYHLLWATRADLSRRCGRTADAARDYEHAMALATNPAERRYLAERVAECRSAPGRSA